MMSFIFNLFYYPLYNGLVFLSAILPNYDLGISIIVLTIIVKTAILPLSHKASQTQRSLKEIEPKLKDLKEKYKDNQDEQALQTIKLYKEHGINPFVSILLLFIQLPMFIALFYTFKDKIDLASPVLFSFNIIPPVVNMMFLGSIDLSSSNIYMAILVGLTQYYQTKLSVPEIPKSQEKNQSFMEDFAKSMNWQVKYFLPVFISYVAYSLNSAVSLFWITSNVYSIIHELFVKRKAEQIKK